MQQIKLSFFDFIKYFTLICKRFHDNKKKQIKFAIKKINQRLDVVYILNKLVEIDKLK